MPPSGYLVQNYLVEIATEFGIDWEPCDLDLPTSSTTSTNHVMPTPTGFSIPMAPASLITNPYSSTSSNPPTTTTTSSHPTSHHPPTPTNPSHSLLDLSHLGSNNNSSSSNHGGGGGGVRVNEDGLIEFNHENEDEESDDGDHGHHHHDNPPPYSLVDPAKKKVDKDISSITPHRDLNDEEDENGDGFELNNLPSPPTHPTPNNIQNNNNDDNNRGGGGPSFDDLAKRFEALRK